LTIGAASINTLGYACQANFSGGSSGVTYVVAWSATLATGVVISRSCSLQVI
jgi:hypothetical protein